MTKTLLLFVFALGANAQNIIGFHGVSVGGSVDAPTIVNHSNQPIMGYVLNRETATGIFLRSFLDIDSLVNGTPIMPGEERSALGMAVVFRSGNEPSLKPELKLTKSYSMVAVLFADGLFIGPDNLREEFSDQLSKLRSTARDTQYQSAKYQLMEADRKDLHNVLAQVVLGIRDQKGEAEADTALARLAALPDVKGESR